MKCNCVNTRPQITIAHVVKGYSMACSCYFLFGLQNIQLLLMFTDDQLADAQDSMGNLYLKYCNKAMFVNHYPPQPLTLHAHKH